MNKSTSAKSLMSNISKNCKSIVPSIFKKSGNTNKKYNKVYVENEFQCRYRIDHMDSYKGIGKFVHSLDIRPSLVHIVSKEMDFFHYAVPKKAQEKLYHLSRYSCDIAAIYTSDLYEALDIFILGGYTLYYKNKPLTRRCIPLIEYNYINHEPIELVHHCLLGGSASSFMFVYTYLHKYMLFLMQFLFLLFNQMMKQKIEPFPINGTVVYYDVHTVYPKCVSKQYSKRNNPKKAKLFRRKGICYDTQVFMEKYLFETNKEWIMDLIEALILFLQDLYVAFQSRNPKTNVSISVMRFLKMRIKSSLVLKLMQCEFSTLLDDLNYTQDQSFQDTLDDFKDLLGRFEEIKESKLIFNIKKILNFAVAFSFFDKLGIPIKYAGYTSFEQELLSKKMSKQSKADFIHSMLSSLHYLTEKGYQYYITGNKSAIFHSSKEYTNLYDKVCMLRMQSKLLANPEIHGFTESKYRSDLDDTIEKLQSVIKFNDSLAGFELNRIRENYNEMRMLRFELTTMKASREHRDAPFSVLLYGDSGIGKTTLKDILFYHYASVFGLEKDKTYCYTRNPAAKYWDGFVSSCWCIILDDIAFKHPALGEDESCMEFLQINNSVPFVPDQAALDKKGTTPLRAKLVIGTTNSKNLNAHFYFSCASAAQRRFPYVITPVVKKEYQDENGMLKSELCNHIEGSYPDYWNFTIEKVKSLKAESINLGKPAKFEVIARYDNITDFVSWYGKTAKQFMQNQAIVKNSINMIANVEVCNECYAPAIKCKCVEAPSQVLFAPLYYSIWSSTYLFFGYFFSWIFTNIFYYIAFLSFGGLEGFLSFVFGQFFPQLFTKYTYKIYAETGLRMQKKLGKYNLLISWSILILGLLASYKSINWIWNKFFKTTELPSHGNVSSDLFVGKKPQPKKHERENVWYNSNLEIDEFNLTPSITSSKSLSEDQIYDKISKNTHYMRVRNKRLNYRKDFRILNIVGNKFLFNNHSHTTFVYDDEIELISGLGYGVSKNIVITLTENDVCRDVKNDLSVVTIRHVNPGPNIMGLIPKSLNLEKQNGFYIRRLSDGGVEKQELKNTECVNYKGDSFNNLGYHAYTTTPTTFGDCGMPMILTTPMGYVLAGLHVGGNGNMVVATRLNLDLIKPLLKDKIIFEEGSPSLSAPSQSMHLGPLHYKSVFNYIEKGSAKIYGSFTGFRRKPKSLVGDTPIHEKLKPHGYSKKYTKPCMNGYLPFRIAALDMVDPVTKINTNVLDLCKESFLKDILKEVDIMDIKNNVHVYDVHTAINGAPGVAYVDRLNVSTSAGNPWKCKKSKFLNPIPDTHDYVATDEIMNRVFEIKNHYLNQRRAHPVFCAHLKDEAVTFKKADMGKTRVFTGAPMDWSIVNRMYYLSTIRLIQNNKFAFEAGAGTVAQSVEWTHILKYLLRKDLDSENIEYIDEELLKRFIAGDYKAFDKRMSPLFILAAFWILIEICKLSGNYTDEDLCILWGIAYDTAYPTVDFNGDLVQFYGSNPSGHPLTVVINSLVNSLYIRYTYYHLNPKKEVSTFKHHVRLFTYGDDNVMTSIVNWFTHTTISEFLATIGIVYTMADKDAESVPFIHLKDVSFLKRSWVWNHELKAYLAPLDHDSIEKMLMTWTRSKVSEENQMMSIIRSSIGEYFFYGRSVYNSKVKLFQEIVHDMGWDYMVKPSTFPTWASMKERFVKSSEKIGFPIEIPEDCFIDENDESDWISIPDNESCYYDPVSREASYPVQGFLDNYYDCNTLYCKNEDPAFTYFFPFYRSEGRSVPMIQTESTCLSGCCNSDTVNDWDCAYPMQSAIQQSNATENNQQEQVQVSFDDENPGEVVNVPATMAQEAPYVGKNAEIEHYLRRPVKIYTYSWDIGGTTPVEIDPWNLYFNHTSIKKKLDNYYLLRCNLNLKFVINASPFHYGALLASYKPLQKFILPARIADSLISQDMANVGFSQLTRTYIYPQSSQGGEMTLPFLWPKEWIDATEADDLTNMGTLRLCPMTALQFANAGTGVPITLQIYAWPDEVVLSGPTVKLAMQSFMDEYGDNGGTISAPASAVAKVAGYLEKAPIIGPFATATKMAASGVSALAKLFGFTNVPVIEDVKAVIPTPFPQIASPEIGTQLEKLTLDPKNELTIDPASVGVTLGDELLIKNFTGRESYITQFPWAISNSADDILFSTKISPNFFRRSAGTQQDFLQGTPIWLASRLFGYWKGDIKIRLKFICSQYHRGRVRVSWDPVGAIGSTTESTTEVYTKIVDLAKCTDITMNIPYMQTTAFQNINKSVTSEIFSNDGAQTHNALYDNGVLTVRVLTDLAAPLNTADIQVLVFVLGGDNLEFANPTEPSPDHRICAYPVQSGFEAYDVEHDDTEMAMEPSNTPSHTYLMYHGEVVTSLRQLFRRMAYHAYIRPPSSIVTSTADNVVCFSRLPRYPVYPGYITSGYSTADSLLTPGTPLGFNYVQWHPITWISQCFLGNRGALNYRVNNMCKEYINNMKAIRSNNWFSLSTSFWSSTTSTTATSNVERNLLNNFISDTCGSTLTNTRTNAGLGFSVPYYSKYKFRTCSALATNTGSSSDLSTLDWFQLTYHLTPAASSNATSTYKGTGLELYVGAGTDYNPIFFVNVPTLYYYSALPNSA